MTAAPRIHTPFSLEAVPIGTVSFLAVTLVASATVLKFSSLVVAVFVWAHAPARLVFGLARNPRAIVTKSDSVLPRRLVCLSSASGFGWLPFLAFARCTSTDPAGWRA